MKKLFVLILLVILAVANTPAQTDVNLADVMSSGTIIYTHEFAKYVLPHINGESISNKSKTTIVPKSFTLNEIMGIKDMVVNYPVRTFNLNNIGTLINNLVEGSFKNVYLKKGTANLVFAFFPHSNYDENYVINIFFSPKKQKWVVTAHDVNGNNLYKAGAQIITY